MPTPGIQSAATWTGETPHLWDGDHIGIRTLRSYYCRYLYMPQPAGSGRVVGGGYGRSSIVSPISLMKRDSRHPYQLPYRDRRSRGRVKSSARAARLAAT